MQFISESTANEFILYPCDKSQTFYAKNPIFITILPGFTINVLSVNPEEINFPKEFLEIAISFTGPKCPKKLRKTLISFTFSRFSEFQCVFPDKILGKFVIKMKNL